MSNRRRIIIILSSVLVGTMLAGILMSRHYGSLSQEAVQQLFINFLFAIAIVVGIGLLLTRMRGDKDKNS
jgi:hypothetical protein